MNEFTTIIMGAGVGKRMKSRIPKVIHKIHGKSIISFVIDRVKNISCPEVIVVVGHHKKIIKEELGRTVKYAFQPVPLGTGDAAMKGVVKATHKNVLILNGDIPLIREQTISALINYGKREKAALAILTCTMKNPYGYGRVIRDKENKILGIIEQADATPAQRRITEINVGVYYGNKKIILNALKKIEPQNNQGELYLTDIVGNILEHKRKVVGFKTDDEQEMMGINTRSDLARARSIIEKRRLMKNNSNKNYKKKTKIHDAG